MYEEVNSIIRDIEGEWPVKVNSNVMAYNSGNLITFTVQDEMNDKVANLLDGAVVEDSSRVFIARFPPSLKTIYSASRVNTNLEEKLYRCVEAFDGTTVCLYYYNDKVHIATRSCCDVSTLRYNGESTFAKMVFDALSGNSSFMDATGLTLHGTHLNWNMGDTHALIIGFRSHELHPIVDVAHPPAWFIAAFNRITQKFEEDLPSKFGTMVKNSEIDITRVKSIEDIKLSKYGVILISKSYIGTYSRVFITSEFYDNIKRIFYRPIKNAHSKHIDHTNRHNYNILFNCLDNNPFAEAILKEHSNDYYKLWLLIRERLEMYVKDVVDIFNGKHVDGEFVNNIARTIAKNESDIRVENWNECYTKVVRYYIYDVKNIVNIWNDISTE